MSISLCMIVKDEEDNLPRCLESVKDIVDEMIIVDTGSVDATVQIAKQYGARLYNFPWNGSFSDARNESLKHAVCDWIMVMDADDEMPKESCQQILKLAQEGDADAYFFETYSFIGDRPGADILKNMNMRLMRNHKGYFYSNAIHEQIYCNIKSVNPDAKIENLGIRVLHYGYLNKNIASHNKRERNISLLKVQLEKNPEHPFTLFNLGSEYYAMGDNIQAIEYFEKAYEKFDPKEGFSSHLILKMAHCYSALRRYDEAIECSLVGLSAYPDFTDLEYFLGTIEQAKGNYILALRHYSKCCEMGEAPNHLNVIIGAGTYRPHLMMANIFYDTEDYDSAAKSCENALKLYANCIAALVLLLKAYCQMELGNDDLKEKIESCRKDNIHEYDSIVFEILLDAKYYDLALEYIEKFEVTKGASPYSKYSKAIVMFYLRRDDELLSITSELLDDSTYKDRALGLQALCYITQEQYEKAYELFVELDDDAEPSDTTRVYQSLCELFVSGKGKVLAEDEVESVKFTPIIFGLLKMLIQVEQFDCFEKALGLLNTATDKTVLCMLAKLYYREKCYGLAYQELIRSIKAFEYIDAEGAKIMHKLKLKGYS